MMIYEEISQLYKLSYLYILYIQDGFIFRNLNASQR